MTHVATLITDPEAPILEASHLRLAADALPGAGAPVWLARGVAADVPFAPPAGDDNQRYVQDLSAALGAAPIDVVVQARAHRRKRLLVADMDSTLIQQECIDELADALGLRASIAAITERSMRGEIAFEPALRERVALLRGLDWTTAMRVFDERISFTPGAKTLARTMRGHGAMTAIVSGGFTLFTARVAEALGMAAHFANTLIIAEDKLTGLVEEPVLGRESKRQILLSLRDDRGLAAWETLAVGDGANDLAMLSEAGLGVAFHAKPAVAEAADARIEHGDLTALLYVQGIPLAAFVA